MNKTLFPKLRFPEFQDEWKSESLGNVYSFKVTYSFSRDQLNYENGSVKNIHYGDIHTKFSTLFDIKKEKVPFINPSVSLEKITPESYCLEGDIVFADASEDMNDVGKSIEIVNVNNEKLVSGMHTLLARQKEKKIIVGFGGYLFKSDRIRLQVQKEAQGAKVYGVSANRLLNIDICFPLEKNEQQKIADCLTSLDDLIAAQSQRVEALQAYKKGLMQNLFPAEGESAPRLRFPEFESAGEWEVRQLGEICHSFLNGGTPSTQKPEFWQGEIPWITGADVVNQKITSVRRFITEEAVKNSSTNIIEKGNLLIVTRTGVGKMAIAPFDLAISQDLTGVYVDTEQSTPEYLYEFLNSNSEKIKSMNQGTSIAGITRESLIEMKVPLPSIPEQQRIAELLSALDEEISAQGEAVAGLKVHKRGLMQGLFPRNEETSEVLKTSEV